MIIETAKDNLVSFNELTLRDYLTVLFKHKWIIALVFLTVIATVYLGLQLKTPTYQASVKMLITAQKQVESPYYQQLANTGRTSEVTLTQSEIVKSNTVLETVVKALKLDQRPLDDEKQYATELKGRLIDRETKALNEQLKELDPEMAKAVLFRRAVEELKGRTEVMPIRDTNLFIISVSDYDPVMAARAANVISRAYIIFDLKQQLVEVSLKYGSKHPTVSLLQDSIFFIGTQMDGAPLDDLDAIGPASVKVIEQAAVPIRPSSKSKKIILALALVMGFLFGIIVAFFIEYFDQTFRSPRDVEQVLGIPHLGSIIRKSVISPSITKDFKSKGAYAKSFQTLSDQIYMLLKDKKFKTIMFAHVMPKEGATSTVINVVNFLTENLNLKVLLVDGNLRWPSLAKALKIESKPSLLDLLVKTVEEEQVIRKLRDNLHVIVSEKTDLNPITLFELSRMKELIEEWKKKYDVIIFDVANLKEYKDALALAGVVDQVALILSHGKSRRQVALRVVSLLKQNGANILGAILTNRVHYIPKFFYERV